MTFSSACLRCFTRTRQALHAFGHCVLDSREVHPFDRLGQALSLPKKTRWHIELERELGDGFLAKGRLRNV